MNGLAICSDPTQVNLLSGFALVVQCLALSQTRDRTPGGQPLNAGGGVSNFTYLKPDRLLVCQAVSAVMVSSYARMVEHTNRCTDRH